MAFLLGCENVHLEYPTKVIFESLSLGIDDGDAIGVVGKNGDGKSSLLRLFDGTIEPDEGRVLRTRGVRVATLAQKDALDDDATVLASILGDTPEYVWASDARVREILDNLVGDLDPNVRIGSLSGGQRRRVDLARVGVQLLQHRAGVGVHIVHQQKVGSSQHSQRQCGKQQYGTQFT